MYICSSLVFFPPSSILYHSLNKKTEMTKKELGVNPNSNLKREIFNKDEHLSDMQK